LQDRTKHRLVTMHRHCALRLLCLVCERLWATTALATAAAPRAALTSVPRHRWVHHACAQVCTCAACWLCKLVADLSTGAVWGLTRLSTRRAVARVMCTPCYGQMRTGHRRGAWCDSKFRFLHAPCAVAPCAIVSCGLELACHRDAIAKPAQAPKPCNASCKGDHSPGLMWPARWSRAQSRAPACHPVDCSAQSSAEILGCNRLHKLTGDNALILS
jgi:hypothetical protein